MKNKLLSIASCFFIAFTLNSCRLDEEPVSTATKEAVFSSESGMQLYVNSFYNILPSPDTGVFQIDDDSDLVARNGVGSLLAPNALSAVTSGGWSWSSLRNINYFIVNAETSNVANKNEYIAVARFFRALFYFDKVKTFGDVPWIDKPIDINDEATLYAGRNSRFEVMDKVLEDLDFAAQNIKLTSDPTSTRITKNAVLAYKTRICLYEAALRKYHTQYNQQGTAAKWYEEVVNAANAITGHTLHQSSPDKAYRELFIARTPYTDETILAVTLDPNLQIYSSANRRFISPTYGNRPSLTRDFVKMYLNIDGTAFTDMPGYETKQFQEEVKNRDLRLKQTIRTGDYHRTENGVPVIAPPNFAQTVTGYQPIKWMYDERFPYDDESRNDNAHIIMRFAEVLLNKAEALTELGRMNNAEWASTIGAIRKRAGISGNTLTTVPTKADGYLFQYYKGKFTNPIMLEIMRERATELIFEGLRQDDLIRWKIAELLQDSKNNGIYVPALGEYDLNGDGVNDVIFYQGNKPTPSNSKIALVDVSPTFAAGRITLSNGNSGEVMWNPGPRQWEDRKYLRPIPAVDLERNPKLGQNPGW